MTRGNQRDKAREKNLKEKAGQAKKNTMTGSQQAAAKLEADRIMQEKQKKHLEKKAAEEAAKIEEIRKKNAKE